MKPGTLFVLLLCNVLPITAQNSLVNGWDSVPVILSRIVAPTFATTSFNIVDYGAVADSTTLCTNAINNAISACNNAGGGKVVVPEGTYLTGAILLKSNVNLYISKGARLKFSTDPSNYLPIVLTRFEGVECYNYSPFLYAYGQENIAVTGSGTLDGNSSYSNWWDWKSSGDGDRTTLMAMGENEIPVSQRIFGSGYKIRPVFIQPHSSKNILIDSVTILNSPMWEINPVLCQNVTISHVTISSHGVNNDGCNPECSKDVWIHDCIFNTGDDCIAIKSGRNNDGRRVNVPSQNIVIQHCTMKDGHGGVVLGSEISGNVRNVFAEDCNMSSPNLDRALRVKTNSVRGGIIENIFLRNIQVDQVGTAYIEVNMNYEEGDAGTFTPIVRNFSVENMIGNASSMMFNIRCYERSPITNLLLKNSSLIASSLGIYQNIRKLQLINTTVNGSVPLIPTVSTAYQHAERYSSKNNWGWSNVYSSFSGNGYMEPVDTDNSITYELIATSKEQDSISFTYANPSTTTSICKVYVNDQEQTSVSFAPTTSGWLTQKTFINLTSGTNSLKLVAEYGLGDLFFDKFTADSIGLPVLSNTPTMTQKENNLYIYPNPVKANISQINFTLTSQMPVNFTVLGVTGNIVYQWKVDKTIVGVNSIPFNNVLDSGLYVLKMEKSDGSIMYSKFIVK